MKDPNYIRAPNPKHKEPEVPCKYLVAVSNDLTTLERGVDGYIAKGWKVSGSLVVANGFFYQPMTR